MAQYIPTDQRTLLAAEMLKAFPDIQTLSMFLRTCLEKNIDEFSRGNLRDIIDAVLVQCEADGRTETVKLLKCLALRKGDVSAMAKGILSGMPPAPFFADREHRDPCQALFPRERPLLNRSDVRMRMAELLLGNGGGPRTLAVHGAPSTGKSHTRELVQHVAAVGNLFRYVYVDLRTEVRSSYDAGAFMKTIGSKMRLNVRDGMPDKQAESAKWLRELRDWFIGELNDREDRWWLVIDGVSQIDPIQDVRDMVCMLVTEAEQNTDMLRLVLLGCADEAILSSGERIVQVLLSPFSEDDVREFIVAVCKRASVSIDRTGIDEAVKIVMTALPSEPRERAAEICKRTGAVTRELLR